MEENKNTKEKDFPNNFVIDNKYIVLDKLGEGGFGKVYLVKGISDEKKYALKVLPKEKCSENNIRYFKREERILEHLKNVKNPYIIKFYEKGEFTSIEGYIRLYYVIDYAEKGDLYHFVKISNIGLGEKYAKILFKKILKGIQFCHDCNICHLDIKTSNILLDDKFNPIIIDFGLATRIRDLSKKKLILLIGQRGTNFMKCPQMFEKIPYNGIDADNFALGTLLFNLVTNQNVFEKANDSIYKHIKDKNYKDFWKSIILNREDLSENFKCLYERMIAYDPTERPRIKDVLKDQWFDEINVLEEKDPEGYKKLEKEYIEYMLQLEKKLKAIIQPTIQTKQEDEKDYGGGQNRSLSFDGEQYFDIGLNPKKINNSKNYKYHIKIKGYIYPVKFMNALMKKIKGKYKDKCELKKSEKKLKFIINFKKEEEEEEKEKEKEEQEQDEEDEEEEDEINEKENNCIMEVKLFDYGVDEYLLCFNKKQGEIEEFYENFLIIKEIVEIILN